MKKIIGILGMKLGITQLPLNKGEFIPVSVISVSGNSVVQVKNREKDGYVACQLSFSDYPKKRINKCLLGHLDKYGVEGKKYLREIRDMTDFKEGQELDATLLFRESEKIKVSGLSKGKGFSGVIKRYNKKRGPMSHGSGYHRGVGALGSGRDKNRVLKGKKMPGRMGNENKSILNLRIEKIDKERQLFFLRGNVLGPKGNLLKLTKEIC